jgi:gluconolactonase
MPDHSSTLAERLGHPQGPDITEDGHVIFAETYLSRLMAISPAGTLSELHYCGGGPNAVLLGTGGTLYFTQNGGQAGDWRAADQRPPSLECLDLSTGAVQQICREVDGRPLLAPHDLAWGPDGSMFMTDSGAWAPEGTTEPGAIISISQEGKARLVFDTGHVFPSGIAISQDGTVFWAECYTRRIMRLGKDGRPQEICTLPENHTPESLKIDENGNFWIAALEMGGFDVVTPAGKIIDFISTGGLPLNGTLHGGRLYVADLGPFDEALPAPQLLGRLQAVDCKIAPGPQFRASIRI